MIYLIYIYSFNFQNVRLGVISKILDKKWVEFGIIISMIVVVSTIFFTPNFLLIKKITAHAFEAVILFLASAMAFLIINKPRIMFTCMAMAMILSLYLKQKSNSGIPAFLLGRKNDFSICQVTISGGADTYNEFTTKLINSGAEIIQIQETTPDWMEVIKNSLAKEYPHTAELNRIDPFGMIIFSKFPIKKIDTLVYKDTTSMFSFPALKIKMDIQGKEVHFISCHLLPRLNNTDFEKVNGFFTTLTQWLKNNEGKTVFVSGELGLTPWDYTLQQFISESNLKLSRREPHLFVQPFEHILYSPDLDCIKLNEVLTPGRNHIGIQGEYIFSKLN